MADITDPIARGTFEFQATSKGDLLNSAVNVKQLGRLWADRTLISGDDLGPGDPGDFDNGAWHSSCHLLGAGGARRARDGRRMWLEISHARVRDEYYASVTVRATSGPVTLPLDSAEGRALLEGSALLGFVEGNSVGRVSARGVIDFPDTFNLWRRQDFDQPINSVLEGGKVWEHWCTLRQLHANNRVGWTALTAYVSLASALGDQFCATVARGRRDYAHPQQLCAMVRAGFVGREAAILELLPSAVPAEFEPLLLEAEPARCLGVIEQLDWGDAPKYFMFQRAIKSWSKSEQVKADLKKLVPAAK